MENPATWTPAMRVISQAIRDHDSAMQQGIVGRSKVKAIADALRTEGYLREDD